MLITLRQLLDHAAENGYGLPAFNINNLEQGLAILMAAEKTNSPVIIQASRGARAYAGDILLQSLIKGLIATFPNIPIWSGEDSERPEKLLIVSEQGLGDTIQFVRYSQYLKNNGFEVNLCALDKLHSLFKYSNVCNSLISQSDAEKVYDLAWSPLLSLPSHLI